MSIHPRRILWPADFSPLSMKDGKYARLRRHAVLAVKSVERDFVSEG